MELPIVDFSAFVNASVGEDGTPTLAQQKVARAIDQACRIHGFVCLRNTGIAKSLVEETFQASKELFDMTDEEKSKLKPLDPTTNTGYNGYRSEALNPRRSADLKEVFNIRNPSDATQSQVRSTNFAGTPPNLQSTALTFWDEVMLLSHRFSQCCAMALGLDIDYFTKTMVQKDLCTLRLRRPPRLATLHLKWLG